MALLFFDGFDHMGTSGVTLASKYSENSATGYNLPVASPVRTGTGACQIGYPSLVTKPLAASGAAIVGFAFRCGAFRVDDIVGLYEGSTSTGTLHVALAQTTGGLLTIKRGSTVLQTSSYAMALNAWYYIELKVVIHDTTGSYDVRVDGVSVLSATGVDTRNGGTTGQWDRVGFSNASFATDRFIDDFYVCDASGAAPRNTFLGAVKVETLYPQTDAVAAGSNAGLTPSTGTDHGALVDETAPNTTDYNSAATVGAKDTYNYPSLSLTGSILGVQTNLYVAKSDTAARQVCAVVRAGGVDYDGANISPLTAFSYFSEVRAQNPNTSNDWTSSDIASLQAGMKVTA
jgi:hypothetical protein